MISDPAKRGLLICLEGLDHSGKTTQCQKIHDWLEKKNEKSMLMRFPERSTALGKTIDAYLKGKENISDEVIHMLFATNRWEFKTLMENEINSGTHIIMDRYAYSGAAFTASKGLDLEWCKNGDRGLPLPDVVFFLDAEEDQIVSRGDFGKERYEKKEFQKLVKENYLKLMKSDEIEGVNIWRKINAGATIDKVNEDICAIVGEKLEERGKNRLGPLKKLWWRV